MSSQAKGNWLADSGKSNQNPMRSDLPTITFTLLLLKWPHPSMRPPSAAPIQVTRRFNWAIISWWRRSTLYWQSSKIIRPVETIDIKIVIHRKRHYLTTGCISPTLSSHFHAGTHDSDQASTMYVPLKQLPVFNIIRYYSKEYQKMLGTKLW